MRGYFDRVVGDVESMRLAPDPQYEWHTPKSVSFNIVAIYTTESGAAASAARLCIE